MACSTVENRAVGDVFPVVDKDGPDLHEEEESEVGEFLQWEDEGEGVVRHRLQPPVYGVEGHGCVRRGHDPLVMRFVQAFVDEGMVQTAVDEVDAEVGEEEEEWELEVVVVGPWFVGERVVEFGVAPDFGEEEGRGEDGDEGHGVPGLRDLHLYLVFEEFGVLEGGLVEDEDVG